MATNKKPTAPADNPLGFPGQVTTDIRNPWGPPILPGWGPGSPPGTPMPPGTPANAGLLQALAHLNAVQPSSGGAGSVAASVAPVTGTGKKKSPAAKSAPATAPFDLSADLSQAAAPYLAQLAAVLGQGTPGLSQYLGAIQGSGVPGAGHLASTVQGGLASVLGAMAPMGQSVHGALANAGQAGLLGDLLNAARYQAIYKQGLYGSPSGTDPALQALYQQVVQGGNLTNPATAGSLGVQSPTQGTTPGGVSQNAFGG